MARMACEWRGDKDTAAQRREGEDCLEAGLRTRCVPLWSPAFRQNGLISTPFVKGTGAPTSEVGPVAFELRPATREDAVAIWRFDRRFSPEALGMERTLDVVVVERGAQQLIGWGSAYPQAGNGANWFALHLTIHPDWRGRGAGGALLAQFLDWLRAMQASEVRVWIREINEEILRFFLKRGFVESRRTSQLLLAVQEVDLASFEPFVEQVSAQGIQIVSLEEEVSRGVDALRTWYDMVQADESQGRTYVEFLEQGVLRWMVPGSCFFARLQDQYVGYSSLYLPYVYPGTEADPGLLEQGYVRVRPPFRNRGIATALAAHVIGFAKRRNYCTIRADVAVTNAPSLAVKAKLGYRQVGGEIWVRKSPV